MESDCILIELIGGLGNQLFQYAAARSLADRHGARLLLDISGFDNYPLRRYELGELNIRAEIAISQDLLFLERCQNTSWPGNIFGRLAMKLIPERSGRVFKEKTFAYNESICQQIPPVYLSGYWQSERYFADRAAEIRQDLSLRTPLDQECQVLIEKIRKSTSVSLHVRRGDYVSNAQTAQFHGTCSLDYYRAAVSFIAARVKEPHFFIFSDDPDWVSENLRLDYTTTLVDVNGADRGVVDMAMMKECNHHIIANSSFSWWGAWLNPAPHKIVIAPKRWFNQATNDTRDLLPQYWIKL